MGLVLDAVDGGRVDGPAVDEEGVLASVVVAAEHSTPSAAVSADLCAFVHASEQVRALHDGQVYLDGCVPHCLQSAVEADGMFANGESAPAATGASRLGLMVGSATVLVVKRWACREMSSGWWLEKEQDK